MRRITLSVIFTFLISAGLVTPAQATTIYEYNWCNYHHSGLLGLDKVGVCIKIRYRGQHDGKGFVVLGYGAYTRGADKGKPCSGFEPGPNGGVENYDAAIYSYNKNRIVQYKELEFKRDLTINNDCSVWFNLHSLGGSWRVDTINMLFQMDYYAKLNNHHNKTGYVGLEMYGPHGTAVGYDSDSKRKAKVMESVLPGPL